MHRPVRAHAHKKDAFRTHAYMQSFIPAPTHTHMSAVDDRPFHTFSLNKAVRASTQLTHAEDEKWGQRHGYSCVYTSCVYIYNTCILSAPMVCTATYIHTYIYTVCQHFTPTHKCIHAYIVRRWYILGHVCGAMHQLPGGNIRQCNQYRTRMCESKY